jgi:CRISPR/Cas system-associated exonuclease Cas4 (RecB family)
MDSIELVTQRLEIPSRYEVIPIHSSDIAAYKACRRRWDWSSPTRTNLRRNVTIYGIDLNLWYGTGIHYALEMFYDPILSRDPVETWLTWFNYQWLGGTVTEDWLDRTYDIHPRLSEIMNALHTSSGDRQLWEIKGLQELLPNPIEEEFMALKDLGVGMMTFYKEYAAKNDNFITVATESTYSIPLGFEAIDQREQSPNYGQLLEVHARGKRDAVIYSLESDRYGIIDHKTAAKMEEDYFEKLELDPQCSNYLWATTIEAEMYDLPWKGHEIGSILYNVLRKVYPKPPTLTAHGKPSINRADESTTPELFEELVKSDQTLEEWFNKTEKAQLYYTYLLEKGDEQFIRREVVRRNEHEIKMTGQHMRAVAKEMLSLTSDQLYPNPSGSFTCLRCAFRAPCIAKEAGYDWQGSLADGYEVNRDR